jgi:hypothetical protein
MPHRIYFTNGFSDGGAVKWDEFETEAEAREFQEGMTARGFDANYMFVPRGL